MNTIGEQMSRHQRRELNDAVIESNYKRGALFAPLQFKADDEDSGFLKPVKFKGFANTGKPDLGDDIVDPEAFTKATLNEFLKFGRQLFYMHSPWAQVGEITSAEVVQKGTRSMFGIRDGGLMVEGFVDSPVDDELGVIPDHELSKLIHAVRLQVRRGRLKLLSIGWRPTKTEYITAKDPRRDNEERRFRHVKALILGEISLVTMAMSPQSMVEVEGLRKAFAGMYGDDIADALFCDDVTDQQAHERIPEKVSDFNETTIRRLVSETLAKIYPLVDAAGLKTPEQTAGGLQLVSLGHSVQRTLKLVSLD